MGRRSTAVGFVATALLTLTHALACSITPAGEGSSTMPGSVLPDEAGSDGDTHASAEDAAPRRQDAGCATAPYRPGPPATALGDGGVPLLAAVPTNLSHPPLTIAFLGDSITAGGDHYAVAGILSDGTVRYSDYAQAFYEAATARAANFRSFGLGGTKTSNWAPASPGACVDGGATSPDAGFGENYICKLYEEILAWKPDYVHIMLGVNDAKRQAIPVVDYVSNIRAMCNFWNEHDIRCLVAFETALNPDATACPASAAMNAQLRQYQDAVRALDDGKNVQVISRFGDPEFDNYARTISGGAGDYVDCFHPTGVGRAAIGETLASSIACAGL